MTCCSEQTASLAKKSPGASQHVNYAKGMVLGVDDFTQEFAYLAGRTEWLARDLGGYGTASGLVVAIEDDGAAGANNPRIRVTSGSALSPRGSLICVSADQCAWINTWLASPKGLEASKALGASPASIPLYLTLCYADCETNLVPIPGEPCRSEDELMKPSRIADDFKLEIRTQPPAQKEEDALRKLVQWLRGIQSHDHAPDAPAATAKELLDALRAAADPWLKAPAPPAKPPNEVPDLILAAPPVSLRISADQRCDLLRVAFRFWVTELRPKWLAMCCGCAGNGDVADDCVLLARLDVPVMPTSTAGGSVWVASGDAKSVVIDESRRPFLVHQRLLQEWLLCGSCCDSAAASSAAGAPAQLDIVTAYPLALTAKHHCVICLPAAPVTNPPAPQKVTLPKCAAENKGRIYIVKSPDAATSVEAATGDVVDTAAPLSVKKGACTTIVSDGVNHWYVIATT